MTEHGGSTAAFPKGSIDHRILEDVAWNQFTRYAAERPQVEFGEPEVTVEQDILHHAERATWRVRSRIRWP